MKKKIIIIALFTLTFLNLHAQQPESMSYTQIYSYLDEMAADGLIHINSVVKPFSRRFIAQKLEEIKQQDSILNKRQKQELDFYLNEFSLERDTIPDNWVEYTNRNTFNLSLAQPAFHYLAPNKKFNMSIKPILGMHVYANKKGAIFKRWYGAEINMDIVHHISIWGSLRDNSWNGTWALKKSEFPDFYVKTLGHVNGRQDGALLTKGGGQIYRADVGPFLNNLPGQEYKEATYGGDFSDSKGGVSVYDWWGSLSFERENIQWGDAYLSSNIISNHAPAVPMISLHLTPCRWFEFNYFHAWLNSNVLDSTNYYIDNTTKGDKKNYRPRSKYMAANMFTFSPIKKLSFSFGNSIIYAENHPNALYFIPIAFFKSLDHLNTKGTNTDNQNSQAFFSISVRNLKHTHFYASFFMDEFMLKRLKKGNPERNPISYLVGVSVNNFPLKNLYVKAEFMRSNIMTYTHHTPALTYTSNGYNIGHYMGDNAQSIYAEIGYKPVRGLDLRFTYTNETKYNCYKYLSGGSNIIALKPFAEKTYQNDTFAFNAIYEVFSGCYAIINISYNNARGFAPQSTPNSAEDRGMLSDGTPIVYQGDELAQYYLNKFSPKYLWGKNVTAIVGLSFNF